MSQIIVIRGAGDKQGPDIIDPTLGSLAAQLARGTTELDKAERQQPVSLTVPYQPNARCGQLLRAVDASLGPAVTGKVTRVRHVATLGGAITELEVSIKES